MNYGIFHLNQSSFTILVSQMMRIPEKMHFLLLKALQGIICLQKRLYHNFKEILPNLRNSQNIPESQEFVATGSESIGHRRCIYLQILSKVFKCSLDLNRMLKAILA